MTIHFDEKGKFFTEIVTKKTVLVTVQTLTHRIHGQIYIRPDERLKDELDHASQFMALTDAIVYDASGVEIGRPEFMVINKNQIVWLIPEQEPERSREREGDEQ